MRLLGKGLIRLLKLDMLRTRKYQMIESLTEEQINKFPEYIKKWTDIGLCTDPANRIEAEKAINESYRLAELEIPKKIVWCGSPLSQGLVRTIILDKKLIENISDSVRDSVWASVRASVWDSIWDSVGASVWDSVWDSVRASVSASVRASVSASVRDSVWDSVRASVWDSVRDSVEDSVRDSVEDSVRASVGDSVGDSVYGQQEASWLGFYEFFRNELNLINQTEKLKGLIELSKHAGWFLPHKEICWVSERHCLLNRDDKGRLHSLNQPSVLYPDGWSIYAVHGVRVPEYIIMNPNQITIKKIEEENNLEIKRIMIERFGQERYLMESNAKMIHKDKFGELYYKEIKNDEPLVMVKVINSTPEPDGSRNNYFIRVDPKIKTAHAAVAWTFSMKKKDYKPLVET